MMQDKLIKEATFNPRVRTYWLMSGAVVFIVTIVGIPLLLLWFPLGWLITGKYLRSMSCELTNKNLKVRKGFLVRVEKTIPLEKITDMGMVQGPIMRWFDVERLTVETAGQSGAGALVSLAGIEHAKDFREAVLAQRDLLAAETRRDTGTTAAAGTGSDHQEEIHKTLLRIEALLEKRSHEEHRDDHGPF